MKIIIIIIIIKYHDSFSLTTEMSVGIGGFSSLITANKAHIGSNSKYGGLPLIISITVQPKLQISDFSVTPCNNITSGATVRFSFVNIQNADLIMNGEEHDNNDNNGE